MSDSTINNTKAPENQTNMDAHVDVIKARVSNVGETSKSKLAFESGRPPWLLLVTVTHSVTFSPFNSLSSRHR